MFGQYPYSHALCSQLGYETASSRVARCTFKSSIAVYVDQQLAHGVFLRTHRPFGIGTGQLSSALAQLSVL
jgi:hypothetical protein